MPPERLLVLALVALAVAGAVGLGRWLSARHTRRLLASSEAPLWAALGSEPDGHRPTVVAFSTPACASCRTAQAPALKRLEHELGPERLRLVAVDAAERPEVASAFGILTVPSTVVLRPEGSVAAANHGFAPAERLRSQVRLAAAAR